MLLISIRRMQLSLTGCVSPVVDTSTIAGAALPLFPDGGGVAGQPRLEQPSRERNPLPVAGEPLLLGTSHSVSPVSGMSSQSADGIRDALDIVQRPVSDVFPPNRIFTKCGKCHNGIPRFKGYKHYWVGDRATYCWKCHQAMGLPLREEV